MNSEGLVLVVAWAGWFALVAVLVVLVARRSRPPSDGD